MSLISRIENYAKKNPFWISGQTYGRLADAAGYKADTASRRLRELAHPAWLLKQHPEKKDCKGCSDGILEHREVKGHVEYRYSPERVLASGNWNPNTGEIRWEIAPEQKESQEIPTGKTGMLI